MGKRPPRSGFGSRAPRQGVRESLTVISYPGPVYPAGVLSLCAAFIVLMTRSRAWSGGFELKYLVYPRYFTDKI